MTPMPKNSAATPEALLAELPEDRRAVMKTMRDLVRKNLPEGYAETISYGMLCYVIPLDRYPKTYNKQPLSYVCLAAQKNYYALYLTGAYGDQVQEKKIAEGFAKAGKKLDMGKSCLRFKKLDDLPLGFVGEVIAGVTPEQLIEMYEKSRAGR